MKNITYLEKLERYIKDNNIVFSPLDLGQEYEKNELNEESHLNHTPDYLVPNIPDSKAINDLKALRAYKQSLADWLGEFIDQSRLSDEFNAAVDLQRKLTDRERELGKEEDRSQEQ